MNAKGILAVGLVAAALAVPAQAQQPRPSGGSDKAAAPAASSSASALVALVAPRAAELRAAGVRRIVARTGRQRRDIQVVSPYGSQYFAWPKGLTPAPFQIDVDTALSVRADGYTEASKDRYAAAFDAIIPEAIRLTNEARARVERPKP